MTTFEKLVFDHFVKNGSSDVQTTQRQLTPKGASRVRGIARKVAKSNNVAFDEAEAYAGFNCYQYAAILNRLQRQPDESIEQCQAHKEHLAIRSALKLG
jgi:hypothetical protein